MRRLTLPLLLVLPALALAENIREYDFDDHKPSWRVIQVEKMLNQKGKVSIAGTVDIPLYQKAGDARSYVVVELEDGSTHRFLVDFGAEATLVTERFAEAAGGKKHDYRILYHR